MKFPKYTREENRACKLSDQQIKEIQNRHKSGQGYGTISKDYGVSPQAIFYWCLDEEERKRRTSNRVRNSKIPFDYQEYRERKKKLHPELTDYELEIRYKFKKENPIKEKETIKNSGKNYWIKHKEVLSEKNSKYQKSNLEKFRKYNKKWRDLHPEENKKMQRENYLRNREKRLAHQKLKYREKHPLK